ncbi:hypothetical protein Dsin_019336 [Dipteronia sinensis]|uniref:LSM domain-containing protein n=1 Tax=Dipteronia sinensis TaxID=43782 RepID=A0AAE0A6Z3_9ROSI|nr:hypothetical protein Dsin_019336 [Dipteronia sinensis]
MGRLTMGIWSIVNCDTWMNIHLREVICTSKEETKSHAVVGIGYCLDRHKPP